MKSTHVRIIALLSFSIFTAAIPLESKASSFDFSTTIAVQVPNKTPGVPTFLVGSTVSYSVTAKNTGNASSNVALNVQFGGPFTQLNGIGGSFSCNPVMAGTTLSCQSTSPLTPNNARTITVTAKAPSSVTGNSQSFTITATMDPANAVPETNEANNQSTTSTTVVPKGPDLTLDLTGSASTAIGAGEVKYHVEIKNIGDRATSTSPHIVATLPSAVHYLRLENSQFTTCNHGNGTLNCNAGNPLSAGAAESAQIVGQVDSTVANNAVISFTAKADPADAINEFDENNNSSSFNTTVTEIADLFISGVTQTFFYCDENGDLINEARYAVITANIRNDGHSGSAASKVKMELFSPDAAIHTFDCGSHKQKINCNLGCNASIASICTSTQDGATCDINPLAPNGTQQLVITVLDKLIRDPYSTRYTVDPANNIVESDEDNNETNHTVN